MKSKPQSASPTVALILAAGRGVRAKGGIPKQYHPLAGTPLLCHSLRAFLSHKGIDRVQVVIHREHLPLYEAAVEGLGDARLLPPVFGGDSRQESARKGLESLEKLAPRYVLIHDAARPLVSHEDIDACLEALDHAEAVVPVLPLTDALKQQDDSSALRHVPRQSYRLALTPQGFDFVAILKAHRAYAQESLPDDAALAEQAGISLHAIEGRQGNFKVTYTEDFLRAEALLTARTPARTGWGYDVHRFADIQATRKPLRLCGVDIPHSKYLVGHSDADVGLHALTDAILGAIAAGDIGEHFPPNDPQWSNVDSSRFLSHANGLARQAGFCVHHVDITFICEAPKLSPYRDAMRKAVAEILEMDIDNVNIKATTTEGLGFLGRGEGIAAQAVANLAPRLET